MDFSKFKLIIFDLDETLWHGTLSEESVTLPKENKQLIVDAVNAGVMCSICSKNDIEQVRKQLVKEELNELFVFNSINWSPKGERVKNIVHEMNLRQVNVLFVDDNATNRGEVKSICPDITVRDVDAIPELIEYFKNCNKTDFTHERLKRYRVLEEKSAFKSIVGSNLEFLRRSNIRVKMHDDCMQNLDRIHELLSRSNQLNFTKIRSTVEELTELINDKNVVCSYVTVTDKFGDYGIVGFFAYRENEIIHFTFSCRTLGMGVEQYVYKCIGKPEINIVGEVSSDLNSPEVDWINANAKQEREEKSLINDKKILLKGPCDLEQMFGYISKSPNILTEFVYVNEKGVRISQGTHTMHIVQSQHILDTDKERLAIELPFGDKGMYSTKIFDPDIDYIVLSLFADPSFGLYREKDTGIIVAYAEYVDDITDQLKWEKYINGEVFLSNCKFTEQDLIDFSNKFQYIGRMKPENIIENLGKIYNNINPTAHLVLVLGSETEYKNNNQLAYVDRHSYHKELNDMVRKWQQNKDRVHLLDVNEFIKGQSNFTNNINHFNRETYYKMSKKLVGIIKSTGSISIKQNSKAFLWLENSLTKIKKVLRIICRRKNNK